MQLSNKQIIDIWKKVKNDNTVTHKVTTAVREILQTFIAYSPTLGFLVYPLDGGQPVYKEKFSQFSIKECKYFIPLMGKPRLEDMKPMPSQAQREIAGYEAEQALREQMFNRLSELQLPDGTFKTTAEEVQ